MSNTFIVRDLLFHELELAVRTTNGLLNRIQADQWDYRPRENMRTLLELAHHLVLVPETDLAIIQEKSQEEVHQYYLDIESIKNPEKLGDILEQGFLALKDYMTSLSEEEFIHKETKAFYSPVASTQAKWLVEIVTHAFHHRAQLFNYLKELGHDVTMFDLY